MLTRIKALIQELRSFFFDDFLCLRKVKCTGFKYLTAVKKKDNP